MSDGKYVACNVFYITSSCNLQCEYCYEKNGRPDKSMTIEDIDKQLKWIDEHLADYSHIVIFGGEPLLKLDLVEHIVNELLTTYKHRQFSISMDTNGVLLQDDGVFERYKKIQSMRQFTTSISYDGPNSYRRRDTNGNCVNDIIVSSIRKLEQNNIDYMISYTWQKENAKTILHDMVYICENFNVERIMLSPACRELDKCCAEEMGGYVTYLKSYIPYLEAIYLEYGIPICEFACRFCRKCRFNQTNVYISPTKEKPIISDKTTEVSFSLWD